MKTERFVIPFPSIDAKSSKAKNTNHTEENTDYKVFQTKAGENNSKIKESAQELIIECFDGVNKQMDWNKFANLFDRIIEPSDDPAALNYRYAVAKEVKEILKEEKIDLPEQLFHKHAQILPLRKSSKRDVITGMSKLVKGLKSQIPLTCLTGISAAYLAGGFISQEACKTMDNNPNDNITPRINGIELVKSSANPHPCKDLVPSDASMLLATLVGFLAARKSTKMEKISYQNEYELKSYIQDNIANFKIDLNEESLFKSIINQDLPKNIDIEKLKILGKEFNNGSSFSESNMEEYFNLNKVQHSEQIKTLKELRNYMKLQVLLKSINPSGGRASKDLETFFSEQISKTLEKFTAKVKEEDLDKVFYLKDTINNFLKS
ncbi:MAG: hypothetical protein MK033_09620 [Candidatus Caenarcaniphilales bacterium]|nr:hypothetical protein [Candidatus Caenarcaniphilales bacterium]